MKTTVSSHAWDIPNTSLVVNLKKVSEQIWANGTWQNKVEFLAGVSWKSGASTDFQIFNAHGDDAYSAFESIMTKIDKVAEMAFGIAGKCDDVDAIPVARTVGWELYPPRNDDFIRKCFYALSRLMYLSDSMKQEPEISLRRREYDGRTTHCGCICSGGEMLFMAKPEHDAKDALSNLRQSVLGALIMLERFQSMAWNVMVDNSDPDYDMEFSRDFNMNLLKRKKEEIATHAE